MAIANRKEELSYSIEKVWKVVTDLKDSSWRSDLDRIEILEDGAKFVEYTKDGFATTFTITCFEPVNRYEFDMENENMKGHWTGVFSAQGEKTVVDFTEDVVAKKAIMKPFVGMYLKKQQGVFIEDLKKALEISEK